MKTPVQSKHIISTKVTRQSPHCIQYKIVVVYSFGNKKWQQLSVTSHIQRYLQERNNNGSIYQLPFSTRFKWELQMYFMWFTLVFFFFSPTFSLLWTLKRVHFSFISPQSSCLQRKHLSTFLSFMAENAFVLHSFKNTSVCTNSYEKNRNDSSEENKTNKKSIIK